MSRSLGVEQAAYDELCAWTLTRGDAAFSHQHVVDAFAAQSATAHDKPIRLTFALVGLYLHLERRYTGKAVQRAHMALARHKIAWPRFALPATRAPVTASDVLAANGDAERDLAIDAWCRAVWESYGLAHPAVLAFLAERGIL